MNNNDNNNFDNDNNNDNNNIDNNDNNNFDDNNDGNNFNNNFNFNFNFNNNHPVEEDEEDLEFEEFVDSFHLQIDVVNNNVNLPNAPRKARHTFVRRVRPGLPRPFATRLAAKKILFLDAPLSPLPPMPQCPKRKANRRAESRIGNRQDLVMRKKLDFDVEEEEAHCSPASGACNAATPSSSLLNAPKKKRRYSEIDADVKVECVEVEEVEVEEEDECPAPPENSPATPADNNMEVDHDERWGRISTPASAPLPTNYDSPQVAATSRRRRSDGTICYGRKRLMF